MSEHNGLTIQPVMIYHRSLGVHVEMSKGLSREALEKIEQMAKTI